MPGVCVTPGAIGIGKIDLYAVDGFRLVLLFRLQDELLEDRVVPRYDTAVGKPRLPP
jgi:hypothetical protein